jgi:osomolarity two-component system, sensor histidine kinase SLN1
MRSLFVPLRLAAEARKLRFVTELDEEIEREAKRAAYRAIGKSESAILAHLGDDTPGLVAGALISSFLFVR